MIKLQVDSALLPKDTLFPKRNCIGTTLILQSGTNTICLEPGICRTSADTLTTFTSEGTLNTTGCCLAPS